MSLRIYQDATAIITGGASGIGRTMALELVSRGSTVILADRQIVLAEELAASIVADGGNAWARELDVCDYSAVQALVDETVAKTGRLDYMFNNAGIAVGGMTHDLEVDDWDISIDVNIRGVTNGVQACYKLMVAQGFGHIVNTASMAGLIPSTNAVPYSTSKFAVVGLSQALRIEAEYRGVRVSALCPGAIQTPILTGGEFGKLGSGITKEQVTKFWSAFNPMPADEFAREAIDQVAKNLPLIIVPGWWRRAYLTFRLLPRLWYRWSKKGMARSMHIFGQK
jgi:NAD(P)-dependent dehydrogenase (short-subunit alcohol dehydrogenase family)